MNYAHTAQNLAAKGRYGDSMLVHMTPREVGGLQALARSRGTSLTINPQTGMPEAFNLKNLLPAIVGAGLTVASGGTLSPLTIGLMTGGLGALATGSLKEGLMIGLGAAGGAGFAGSAANLAAPAAAAPASATTAASATSPIVNPVLTSTAPATSATLPSVMTSAPQPLGAATFGGSNIASSIPSSVLPGAQTAAGTIAPGASTVAPGAVGAGGFGTTINPTAAMTPTTPVNMGTVGEGLKTAFSSPESAGTFLSNNKMNLATSMAPSLLATPEQQTLPEQEQYIRPYELVIDNASGDSLYAPGSTEERRQLSYTYKPLPIYRAAQGGIVAFAEGGESSGNTTISPEVASVYQAIARTQSLAGLPALNMSQFNVAQRPERVARQPFVLDTSEKNYNIPIPNVGQSPSYQEIKGKKDKSSFDEDNSGSSYISYNGDGMKSGGIASYKEGKEVRKKIDRMAEPYDFADFRKNMPLYQSAQQFAQGGQPNTPRFLSGGGDGMSDSIPAVIADKQPARLADGEFVIPADVVSHLGNGSSKAGAKQLYAMMDRIREGRTGKKKQAPEVNPKKYMPA